MRKHDGYGISGQLAEVSVPPLDVLEGLQEFDFLFTGYKMQGVKCKHALLVCLRLLHQGARPAQVRNAGDQEVSGRGKQAEYLLLLGA
jgi:hypothetical protein